MRRLNFLKRWQTRIGACVRVWRRTRVEARLASHHIRKDRLEKVLAAIGEDFVHGDVGG